MTFRPHLIWALAAVLLAGCGGEPADPAGAADAGPATGQGDAGDPVDDAAEAAEAVAPAPADPDLVAQEGFRAAVFHEGVGAGARHLVVRDNGDVLVALRSGSLVALRDEDGDGRADRTESRSLAITTGIALHDGHLYFSDDVSVHRLPLGDTLMPAGEPELVAGGFPQQGSHAAKTIAFDSDGNLYVNVGAPSNACQVESRTPGSPGQQPCPQLERQAAIWKFPAGALGLDQSDGERYVTGTRNVIAMDWNTDAGALFFAMHGRDQLNTLWPEHFDDEDNAEMPAEEFHRADAGADYGWPYTFYDPRTDRRLVAPEYGGDGEQEAPEGRYREPLHAFPAHWAPNDLEFYDASMFPERYRGGAFIAWRGSWNRAPLPQDGYRITFLPFADGVPSGEPEDFLTGFKGADEIAQPSAARYRPMGLGIGPDGALFVGETESGRIWRVSY